MAIMVTGGSGFIGANTAKYLADEMDDVIIFDMVPPSDERKWLLEEAQSQVKIEYGDIKDLGTLLRTIRNNDIKQIVHASAIADPILSIKQPRLFLETNVEGTLNILELARISDIERIVYTSSIGVYAPKQYEPMDENHPVISSKDGPSTIYAVTKLAGEALGLNYSAYHGVDFISLRLSSVYGVGMKWPMHIKPIVENSVRNRPTIIKTGTDMRRVFTYVKDVARAIHSALQIEKTNLNERIFTIAPKEEPVTIREIGKITKRYIPNAKIEIRLSEDNEVSDEIENLYQQRALRIRGRLSIERAEKTLGWDPKYDIKAGTKDYIDTYRRYLESSN